ncbi:hypothetical protein EPN29_12215 [bacterium]|nr:MAG: hypothetical protein EPN29_12215 [bacterium]
MNCSVCGAPTLPLEGACVFCHVPTSEERDSTELLDYLVERVPIAKVKRGHLNRGPITEVMIEAAGRSFRARVKSEGLELVPPVDLTAWVDLLLTGLSDAAAVDADLRRAVLRSGWALR